VYGMCALQTMAKESNGTMQGAMVAAPTLYATDIM